MTRRNDERVTDSIAGLRVVWDSPVLGARDRDQLEQLLTRVLHEALWEMLEQHPSQQVTGEGGGDDDDAA